MKGFGYLEFSYTAYSFGGVGLDIINAGLMSGNYEGKGATVINKFGKLKEFTGEGFGTLSGKWASFDDEGNRTWSGNSSGISVGIPLLEKIDTPVMVQNGALPN